MSQMRTDLPPRNETVWIFVNDGKSYIRCQVHDRAGLHMGWHSGTRWHSYFDKTLADDDSRVTGWQPLI